ncbi:MAG: putative large rane protein, partial [Cyanobacteria bacterium RYN_339]|nr:putative large rane protein [Cyanobacteria bacterium RYN_339]
KPPLPPPPPPPAPPMGYPVTATLPDQTAQMRAELAELHGKLDRALNGVNRVLAQQAAQQAAQQTQPRPVPSQVDITTSNAGPAPAATDAAADMARQQAGLAAVQSVLRQVKPGSYSPAEQATINGAVSRVRQIGQEIAGGADPAEFSAELFALKHTIADPAGVGNHRTATSGAQVIQLAEEAKDKIAEQLDALDQRAPLSARDAARKEALTAQYGSLVKVEKALDTAKLTQLTANGNKVAADAVNRLGAITEALAGGKADPKAVDPEIYRLGQVLRDPDHAPRLEAVEAGASVLRQIDTNSQDLKAKLSAIDTKIAGGAAPEQFAAQRADLLGRLEALNELGGVVRGARADQRDQASRRDVALGLQQAAAIAEAIGAGDGPAAHRSQVFVLKQTFQEPRASRDNPAIQSGAAALQLLGRAEARIQKQREAIQAEIAGGAEPRALDVQSAKLNRRAEDIEAMRHAIELANFGGLTPAQEAHGAELIDQMRDLSLKVANGEDFAKVEKPYKQLAKQLMNLNNWKGAPRPAVDPQPIDPRPTRPILRPLPTAPQPAEVGDDDVTGPANATDDKPIPAPAPAKPAPKPAEATTKPAPAKTELYTVKADDYLTKIAREHLGDANRWPEIVELNKAKYPSLAKNPDLIYDGWVLQLPAGGGAKPAEKPAPKPQPTKPVTTKPKPVKPKPQPPVAVEPAPTAPTKPSNGDDREATAWLKANMSDKGISRADVERWMPEGSGKKAVLKYFDALMFGYIDPGAEGWNNLFAGDIDRMQKAVDHDHTIKELADRLTEAVLTQREVGDVNQDGKIDDADLKAYVAQLRGMTAPTKPTPVPPTPVTPPAPKPSETDRTARMQRELQTYLDDPKNQDDSNTTLSLLKDHPQFAEAATPAQKSKLIQLAIDGHANKDEKAAALKVLQLAATRHELDDVLDSINARKGEMKDLLSKLDSTDFAKLLLADGNAYREPAIYSNMDDNATATLCKALGFKHPMVGQSDELLDLPEEAKYKMIKELTTGNVTWTELYMAQWINSHNEIPYRIPEYLTTHDNQ